MMLLPKREKLRYWKGVAENRQGASLLPATVGVVHTGTVRAWRSMVRTSWPLNQINFGLAARGSDSLGGGDAEASAVGG